MANFDPKATRKGAGDQNKGVPAGDYLLAIKSFTRRNAKKSGQPYLNARILVVAGQAKGKSFFSSISLDTTNEGSMFRLSLLAEGVGQTEPFDLDSDASVHNALCMKPFKARVSRKISGDYVNNDIERYLIGDKDVSPRERELMNEWLMEIQEAGEMGLGTSRPADDDIPF